MVVTSCAEIQTASRSAATLPLPARKPYRATTLLVAGSIRDTSELLTRAQTAPWPTAMSPPYTFQSTSIVAAIAFVAGSIRITVPSSLLSTQTAPSPVARNPVPRWDLTSASTAPVTGSRRETIPVAPLVTESDPKPYRTALAPSGAVRRSATTSFLRGSTRAIPLAPSRRNTPSGPTATDDSGTGLI